MLVWALYGAIAMADVFISYSRSDRARVEPIAAALEAEGYSVWWDSDIRPGETWDEVIERELRAAACVIVVWSASSVVSKFVRAEASEADERRVLVPVRLESVRVPLAFKLIQHEDFSRWGGDRGADCWQRVMLQVAALAKGSDPAGLTPGHTAPKLGVRPVLPEAGEQRGSDPGSRSTTLLTVSALGILGAGWVLGAADRSPVITTTVILTALAFVLFRLAEDDLSPGMKAMARRWMMPVEGKVEISTVEAFNGMFEAVFGRRHFSWFCFWRSAVASVMFFLQHLPLRWIIIISNPR